MRRSILADTEYKYYCTYNSENDNISYYCNECKHQFNFKSNLVNHFLEKNNCKQLKKQKLDEYLNTNIKILQYTNKENKIFEYYRYFNNDFNQFLYVCNHCKKESKYGISFIKDHFNIKTLCIEKNRVLIVINVILNLIEIVNYKNI